MEASSNSCVVVEVGEEYPYPSHVCAPNFVTVKLSCREMMYGLWNTQMLCLLKAHGLLGFIHTISQPQKSDRGKEKVGDYMLWGRSDALVKGWILGSLSEHVLRHSINLFKTNEDFSAKDIWDKLKTIYGPATPLIQPAEDSAIQSEDDAESNREAKKDEKKETEKKKVEEEKKPREEDLQRLYKATLKEDFIRVENIYRACKVKVREKVTINGNTALHVAVGTSRKKEFLESMLNLATANDDQLRLDMKNSEGSTLLPVAAIVGNTEAAKILVEKDRELLFAQDKEGHTPLARAFSYMHTDTYLFLLNSSNIGETDISGSIGDELLVNAISSNDYDLAGRLLLDINLYSDAVLMAIGQNYPRHLKTWERSIDTFLYHLECKESTITSYVRKKIRNLSKCTCRTALGAVFYLIPCVVCGVLCLILLHIILILVRKTFISVLKIVKLHAGATRLLVSVCGLIKDSNLSTSRYQYYANPVLEATIHDAYEVVQEIEYYFPDAIWCTNEDGHNIIQLAVINRSVNVYNLLYQMSEHKNVYKTIKDPIGNNLLHLAARLAPTNKLNYISGAALQIQHELQWFKEVRGFVCPLNITQQNAFGETPQMVFTREHKELVIEGEKWMKTTAESYTITAALITTIVFAAAITVPGGNNQDTGIPIFHNNTAFTIFAISDAISLFTSVTSLLMFLSILTARFAEQDFFFKLPTKLVIGLAALFISTTAMIVAFGATLFLVFSQGRSWILIPIAALTCLPIISFVTLQFPLIVDLVSSTYGCSIFGKKREFPFY